MLFETLLRGVLERGGVGKSRGDEARYGTDRAAQGTHPLPKVWRLIEHFSFRSFLAEWEPGMNYAAMALVSLLLVINIQATFTAQAMMTFSFIQH